MIKHSEEFKREAVRIALTSGLPRERVAADLGIGKSTLGKWLAQYRPTDLTSAPQADLARENERLAKDFEQTIASATAWLFIASVQLFARRIARSCNYTG